jgi:hypothetical protein
VRTYAAHVTTDSLGPLRELFPDLEMGSLADKLGIVLTEASGDRSRRDDAGRGQHAAAGPPARGRHRRAGGDRRLVRRRRCTPAAAAPVVGVDLNATHHRAVTAGQVTAVATPGTAAVRSRRTTSSSVTPRTGRVCTARLTCLLRDAPA